MAHKTEEGDVSEEEKILSVVCNHANEQDGIGPHERGRKNVLTQTRFGISPHPGLTCVHS